MHWKVQKCEKKEESLGKTAKDVEAFQEGGLESTRVRQRDE